MGSDTCILESPLIGGVPHWIGVQCLALDRVITGVGLQDRGPLDPYFVYSGTVSAHSLTLKSFLHLFGGPIDSSSVLRPSYSSIIELAWILTWRMLDEPLAC